MKNKKKLIRNIIIILALIYAVFTLIKQQNVINQYVSTSKDLASQIEQEKAKKATKAKNTEKEITNLLSFKKKHAYA